MDISKYLHNISTITLKRGHVIFREGDNGDNSLYFIFEGQVDIIKMLDSKNKVINSLKTGAFFGEMALIKNIKRTASAIISSEYARVAIINRETFLQLSRGCPEFLFELIKICIERVIIAERRLDDFMQKSRTDNAP